MKKQLTVALGLAVLATPAFASKARLQALGEDIYGSFYINDNRNVWLNPAQINNHKDLVTLEWGDNDNLVDQAGSPRAEGGIYKSHGNLIYGVHFGSASNSANQLRAAAGILDVRGNSLEEATFSGNANESNNVDVFIGGDAGFKWGANIGYAKTSEEDSPLRAESLRTRLGVIMGDLQVYANINLINNAKGETFVDQNVSGLPVDIAGASKFEGKLGGQLGAIYGWEGNSLFVDYRQFDAKNEFNGGSKEDQNLKQAQAGIGRVTRLNDRANLFTRASFLWASAENDNALAETVGNFAGACSISPYFCEEYTTMRVPVVVGVEAEATSWLTLRASVSQAIWGTEEDKDSERTLKNNTVVNAGATLKFGELSLDGVIGNSNGEVNGIGESTANGNGSLRFDNLMTRVGMTYRF